MSEKKGQVLSTEGLEKSWNDSKAMLKSLLEDDNVEPLSKAKKDKAEEESSGDDAEMDFEGDGDEGEGEPEEEESEAEEAEEKKKEVKKSLDDEVSSDEEAAAAMDVEPFLRQFVKSISKRFDALEKANKQTTAILAKSLMSMGDQNMTIVDTVNAIAEAPVGSRSVIRKSMDRFGKETEPKTDLLKGMSTDQILEKAVKLSKSGMLTSRDVAKIQMRLNKGIQMSDEYVTILMNKEEK